METELLLKCLDKRDLYLNRMIAFQDKEMIRDHERSGDKGA